MNSRERAHKILNHQEADRPAIDLGATRMTGTSAWSYRALKRALGIDSEQVRVYDLYQMLAEVETPVLDAVGADFAMLPAETLAMGMEYGAWKPFTFWDGQTFEVPATFHPLVTADGGLEMPNEPGGPVDMRMPSGGRFFDLKPSMRKDIWETPLIPESEWQFVDHLDDAFLRREEDKARALFESTTRSIVTTPPAAAPQGYGDTYYWAIQMMTEPEYCRAYMMRAGEAAARCFTEYLQAVGRYVDVVIISGHDYGTQDREMFRPNLFAEFYVPAWKLVTDAIHRFPAVKTWIHCCGSVPHLLQHFVDAGVDCLNPVQWTAKGMDLAWMKKAFGDKLVFWGGAISTQRTFPFGNAADVAHEARQVLDIMSPGGGFVVNPIHNILPEVPVENIVALYETAKGYRYPGRA
jgi:uroporphyrinogen decarboxylase